MSCPACTSTSSTTTTAPPGSNCCLRVRYVCKGSTWVLDVVTTACLANASCSPFSQTCTPLEYTFEQQNACVCTNPLPTLPTPTCSPSCGTTTTSTTTSTTSTTTSTTSTSSTTTTAVGPNCPDGGSGSITVNQAAGVSHTYGPFPLKPGSADPSCCYAFSIFGELDYPAAFGHSDVDFAGPTFALGCGGSGGGIHFGVTSPPGGPIFINGTYYVCDNSTFTITIFNGFSSTLSGSIGWSIILADPAGC